MSDHNSMGFEINDCSLITRMAGVRDAMNLRELAERLKICPEECLFHHFCETVIRPTFDYPEFPNDFAYWASSKLRDSVLAERLALINPYKVGTFDDLRQNILDIVEERMREIDYIPWAPKSGAFHFLQAATAVFTTGIILESPDDLFRQLPLMTRGSIYYHFVESRRRTEGGTDDFSAWLVEFGGTVQPLIKTFSEVDFYFLSLTELQNLLVAETRKYIGKVAHA